MIISTPQKDRQLFRMVRTNCFSAPCLRMQMIRRFGKRMSVWTIRRRLLAAGYWTRLPARCPKLTLEHRWRRHEWRWRHRMWDLRQWRHCIFFSDEFWFWCAVGMGKGWLMPASSLMMEIMARQSLYGVQSTIYGGGEWAGRGGWWSHKPTSVHPYPEESNVAMGDGGDWT